MILCVILHYGNEDVTWDCVNSIISSDFLDIIIADNDPSQTIKIPLRFINKVRLFRTGGNDGFAEANNKTVLSCRNETHNLVLLLNNDTLVLSDALERLREVLDDERVGAVGPCMPFASFPGKIWACGGYIKKIRLAIGGLSEIIKPEPYEVDYLPGAAILCKLSVWDLVGGLPEKYFLAYEEAEFALRIRKHKFRIMVCPKARILHDVGMSDDIQPMYVYNKVRNRMKFGRFLWGQGVGYLLAMFWTLITVRHISSGVNVWLKAVNDEIRGVALNRATLQDVKSYFRR